MTDDDRLQLERAFDNEPPGYDGSDIARSLESVRYLDQLAALRRLAVRHDPGSIVGPPRITKRPPSHPIRRWAAAATLAAATVGLAWIARDREPTPLIVSIKHRPPVVTRPLARAPRPINNLEVAICRWANMPTTSPDRAARLLLLPSPTASRKRTVAVEVLALELANAEAGSEGKVRRFAVSRHPRTRP